MCHASSSLLFSYIFVLGLCLGYIRRKKVKSRRIFALLRESSSSVESERASVDRGRDTASEKRKWLIIRAAKTLRCTYTLGGILLWNAGVEMRDKFIERTAVTAPLYIRSWIIEGRCDGYAAPSDDGARPLRRGDIYTRLRKRKSCARYKFGNGREWDKLKFWFTFTLSLYVKLWW